MERDRRGTEAGSAEMQRAVDCRTGIEWRNLKVEAGVRGGQTSFQGRRGTEPGDSAEKTFFPSLLCPPSPPAPVCRGQVPSP